MSVSVISFGFKYGIPIEADLVLTCDSCPIHTTLRSCAVRPDWTRGVRNFVFGYQQTRDFMTHLENLMGFLLPRYVEGGKGRTGDRRGLYRRAPPLGGGYPRPGGLYPAEGLQAAGEPQDMTRD